MQFLLFLFHLLFHFFVKSRMSLHVQHCLLMLIRFVKVAFEWFHDKGFAFLSRCPLLSLANLLSSIASFVETVGRSVLT